jgi:hypothetical protein
LPWLQSIIILAGMPASAILLAAASIFFES